jgi:adenylate kinase family enzyme
MTPSDIGTRIHVLGCSGSGKSTLAAELARRLGGDFIELDSINHLPNWKERDLDSFRKIVAERVASERWACDGNYSKVRDLVWARAETLVTLDYSFPITFARVFRRTIRRWAHREVLWNGNREILWRHLLTRESLFLWGIQTHRRCHLRSEQWLADPALADKNRLRFRHPREAAAWLQNI